MGSPCTASTPQYASAYSSHLGVVKLRWLSCLWKLSVIPKQPACKPSHSFQERPFWLVPVVCCSSTWLLACSHKVGEVSEITRDEVAAEEESHHGPREGERCKKAQPVHDQHEDCVPIVLPIPASAKQRCLCGGVHVRQQHLFGSILLLLSLLAWFGDRLQDKVQSDLRDEAVNCTLVLQTKQEGMRRSTKALQRCS